ncbi:hypothetical protein VTI28DRAFT_2124 [Corynascus sepedonium]
MADITRTCAYVMGTAQRPGKREVIDFVLLHTVTLDVFYPAFLAVDRLSGVKKARLLEAAARVSAVTSSASKQADRNSTSALHLRKVGSDTGEGRGKVELTQSEVM